MSKVKRAMTLLATGVAFVSGGDVARASAQEPASPVAGTWRGTLDAGVKLTIIFHVTAAPDGSLTAKLDSPDQGATGIPVSEAKFTDGVLVLKVAAVGGEYEGRLAADGSKITGEWRQGGLTMPLDVARGEAPARRPRPQEPVPPLPYDVEDVRFANAGAGIELAGTLTLPRSPGPHPAAVLISGSGAQDRDESLLGHKPFLVLADHLTRNGIAVLRYDDRGTGESGGIFATATSADFATDALAAVTFLKARSGIDAAKIGLIGHSEGGLIAPMAAVRSSDVAYLVLMAGPGVPGEDILLVQIEKLARGGGASEASIQRSLRAQSRVYEAMRAESDSAALRLQLRSILRAAVDSLGETERNAVMASVGGDVDAYIDRQIRQITSPWFRYFLSFDPRTTLERVTVPVLAINGELDVQVAPEQNLPEIEAALRRAGNADITVRRLPGLNHLLQSATTGLPAEYSQIDETMSPAALGLMSSWIVTRFGPGARR